MRAFDRLVKSRQSGRLGILAAILVLLAAGGWAVWREQSGAGIGEQTGGEPLLRDFAEVWSWSESAFAGGAKQAEWSLRCDGRWPEEQARSLAERLGISLSRPQNNRTSDEQASINSDNAYTGAKNIGNGIKVTFWVLLSEQQDGLSDAVILLQADKGASEDEIAGEASVIRQAAGKLGLEIGGSFSARGKPAGDDAAARIVENAAAKRVEGYDDGRTSSITYYTLKLETQADSAGRKVNLQIAVTRPDAGADAELVLGVPLITGDYSMQDD